MNGPETHPQVDALVASLNRMATICEDNAAHWSDKEKARARFLLGEVQTAVLHLMTRGQTLQ